MNKEIIKKELTNQFLQDKTKLYELTSTENEILNLAASILESKLDEYEYLEKENKRLLNEKLNLEDIVDELREQIKELKN